MKDPISLNDEFIRDISVLKDDAGNTDSFKWETAYRELGQSESEQKRSVKWLRETEGKFRDRFIDSFESKASPMMNTARQTNGFGGLDHDITERKRVASALPDARGQLEQRVAVRTAEWTEVNDALRIEVNERRRLEAALQEARDQLEARVADRTDELTRANDALRTEIAERKRIEAVLQEVQDQLEARVADRTAELTRVNDALQTEAAERMRVAVALQELQDQLEARVADRTDELMRANDDLRTEVTDRKRTEAALQEAFDQLEARAAERTNELVRVTDALRTEIAGRKRAEAALQELQDQLEARVADRTAELERMNNGLRTEIAEGKETGERLQLTLDNLQRTIGTTLRVMGSALEMKDPYTAGHQRRSTSLALGIAGEMGLSQDRIDAIRIAGSLHDVGKLSIPAEIVLKPGKLSEIELSLIQAHAKKGYEILKDVESSWPLAEIVHQHHERMDGSGYPRHLKGEDICVEARIMAVADVVEAMTSPRAYRPALGIEAALEEIEKNRGALYDSTVADACLQLFREKGFRLAEA